MADTGEANGRRHKWRRWSPIFLLLVVATGFLYLGTGYTAPGNVHSAVYAWAGQNPGQPVPVLVQTSDSASVSDFITSSGGAVRRQFSIVPVVEAEVPASFVSTLAAHHGVDWISLDAPVVATDSAVPTGNLATTYPYSVGANDAWNASATGNGVGVAIVDTGISPTSNPDFLDGSNQRVIAQVAVAANASGFADGYGHGTHVAGLVGGNGNRLNGKYIGVAPRSSLINVKVADDQGNTSLGNVIAGLEWVYNNRKLYNIRVVNLSLHSSVAQSYQVDPLDTAVEVLWFNGVFVVVAAGNLGTAPDAVSYPPANDPFVMTVGAIEDQGTRDFSDDQVTSWSSRGVTQDGFQKPELFTPGRNIVSVAEPNSILFKSYPSREVDNYYFQLSGTSMSAGVMSGVAALVLERHNDWTPGQLKCTLMSTARPLSVTTGFFVPSAGAAANQSSPTCNSNAFSAPSRLLGPMMKVAAVAFVLDQPSPSTTANAIGMNLAPAGLQNATLATVDWSAIKWDAIKWDAIKWDAIKWDAIKWDAIKWDAIKWDAVTPGGVNFSAIKWDAIKWDAIKWDAIKWSAIKWDAIKWDAIKWDAIKWAMVTNN